MRLGVEVRRKAYPTCPIHPQKQQNIPLECQVIVLDRRTGPLFFTLTKLENVPGMPGAKGVEIMKRLREQAVILGADVTLIKAMLDGPDASRVSRFSVAH